MAQDYGHFADGSSAAFGRDLVFAGRSGYHHKSDTGKMAADICRWRAAFLSSTSCSGQLTPSFFCRLDDDVVYWNTSRLPG
jgi:hypothetical protein